MAFRYTNREGQAYYLHSKSSRHGKPVYYFAKTAGENAVDRVPDGHEVGENANGLVYVRQKRARVITPEEEELIRSKLERLHRSHYCVQVKGKEIVILEPDRPAVGLAAALGLRVRYSDTLKFTLTNAEKREYEVSRMTYRGRGGWSYPLAWGPLRKLADRYLAHLGEESFFGLC